MTPATGQRINWLDLPEHIRHGVAGILGAPVVGARSQPGGFSPGTADRVVTAAGDRAFVKAVSPAQNEHSPVLHRREARITAALPAGVPAPRLLGTVDDGTWIALVLADVPGRHPATPWLPDELARVMSTLDELARQPLPDSLAELRAAPVAVAKDFAGWERVAADPPADLDPWAAARLPWLREQARRGLAALAGDRLVHCDMRADNLLVTGDSRVTVVDWPHAVRGAGWFDRLAVLLNVRLYGGDGTADLARLAEDCAVDRADLVAALVGFAGYFTHAYRLPPPPGLPTARAFQRAQSVAVLGWLRELVGD